MNDTAAWKEIAWLIMHRIPYHAALDMPAKERRALGDAFRELEEQKETT